MRANAPETNTLRYADPKPSFGVRIADIAALREDGSTVIGQRKVPTLPAFDQAFAAFAKGTIFKSKSGFLAVEDLQPGDWLSTSPGTYAQVTWIGSAVFSQSDLGEQISLTRIMADSFGVDRPDSFVSFGPAARIQQTPPDLRGSTVAARLMTPASRFLDGVNVIEAVPPSPVRLFHLGLKNHTALIANGMLVESYHPGPSPVSHMSQTLRTAFLALFPHVKDLSDFGPMLFARAPEDTPLTHET